MAPKPTEVDDNQPYAHMDEDELRMTRGVYKLGLMAGVFVVGTGFGMALPAPVFTRALTAAAGCFIVWLCLRELRCLNKVFEALDTEQEKLRRLRVWSCTSMKFKCEDPLPHMHRGDEWDYRRTPEEALQAREHGDKVYA